MYDTSFGLFSSNNIYSNCLF